MTAGCGITTVSYTVGNTKECADVVKLVRVERLML